MKSNEEIVKQAKELCPRTDSECAIFLSGFIAGFRAAEKEYGYGQDSEENQ